ncbi:stomatin-like protein [Seminavis robusta]|uniref:Stomatin-like protein n=1 Tax=Seminavis robusta TaxID=568900 RepID=A0A9N8HGP8_9STRA|nr:stomatin-like protein [Seminavis robusta]|eukprot:Sro495_g154560.1 stomatin-like protein (232) ;mRNA; r:62342-63052
MRSAIGEMELDEILHGRARLNSLIKGSLQEAHVPFIRDWKSDDTKSQKSHQITNYVILPTDKHSRRDVRLRCEVAAEINSLTNESEGNLSRSRMKQMPPKQRSSWKLKVKRKQYTNLAEAQAQALRVISAELNKPGGQEAARLALAREYVTMYGEMGKQSNTILFNERPADVNALLTQAVTAMQAASSAMPATTTNPPPAPKETITAAIVDTESSEAVDTKAEEKSNNKPV